MKMVQRMKNTRVGRLVCRLFGEERGAVMMEYVIVAVLIAAAAVAAVAYFGKNIVDMFGVAAKGATGDSSGAISARDDAKNASDKRHTAAINENAKFSNISESDSKSSSSSSSGGE